MGEGKPLGARVMDDCLWTCFRGCWAGAWRWPDRSAREATARIRLALRLAPVSRFERFEKPSTSVGPAQAVQLVRNLSNQGIRSASGSSC